jgi:hypothetical protein
MRLEACKEAYQNVFLSGQLPAADDAVAKEYAKSTPPDQRELTTKMFTFLMMVPIQPNSQPNHVECRKANANSHTEYGGLKSHQGHL